MAQLRVYLSSTYEDLKDYRAAVFAALERGGLSVTRMEAYTAADERPLDVCLQDVAQSDIYVGMFAWRYGYEPPASHGNLEAKSITELEYREAVKKRRRTLLFFAHTDTQATWPAGFNDELGGEPAQWEKLKAFRAEAGTEKTCSFFHTPDELAALVLAAILRSGVSGRIYNLPPLQQGLVARPALTAALVAALTGSQKPGQTVVQGAGGIGKTSLALSACTLPEVAGAFADGTLWATLGEKPDMARILGELHVAVTGNASMAGSDAIGQQLAKALAQKRCLVVVDDVWRADDLQPFLALEGLPLLVTTRIRNLVAQAGLTGWSEIPVDEMEAGEGAAVLARGLTPDDGAQGELLKLANQLGCWPLLLDLAHSRLLEEVKARGGDLGESIERIAQLFQRRGVLGFDRRDSNARNAAMEKSVAVSLEFAEQGSAGISRKAAELSIFPEDTAIPVAALANLWSIDEFAVEEDILRFLDNVSLLRWDRRTNEVTLHDMIRRALAARLADPAAVHRRLLEAWPDPRALPHRYAWLWFGWHCALAAVPDRLLRLLVDVEWLQNKLAATDVNALLAEFNRVPGNRETELVKRVCRQSAEVLARDKAQLPGQLLARIPKEEPLRDRLLERAQAIKTPWLRPLTPSLAGERSNRWLRPREAEGFSQLAFSSNGRWASHASYTGSGEGNNIVLWDLLEWQCRGPRFHTRARSNPYATALSDDGRWFLYGDSIGGIHRLGQAGETWEGRTDDSDSMARLLALSADGTRALAGYGDRRLIAWDIEQDVREVIWEARGRARPAAGSGNRPGAQAICLDALGATALVARDDGSVVLLELWPARERILFKVNGTPAAIARSHDNAVAVATVEGGIDVRLLQSPAKPVALFQTDETPACVAVSTGAGYVAVGTDKGSVHVWNVTRGAYCAQYLHAHTYEVARVVFSAAGTHVISGDTVHLKEWESEAPEVSGQVTGPRVQGSVAVTADGRDAVAVLEDGRLGIWDLRTGRFRSGLSATSGSNFGLAGVEPAERIGLAAKAPRVLAWNAQLITVWDLAGSVCVGSLRGESIRDAAIAPDGTAVVCTAGERVLHWRVDGSDPRTLRRYSGDAPGFVAISPDGKRAASSGGSRSVYIYVLDRKSGRRLSTEPDSYWPDSRDKPSAVAFSGPEEVIVTTGDGSLFVLDLSDDSPTPKRLQDGPETAVRQVLMDREGKLFVTSSRDGAIRLWHRRTRRTIAEHRAHPGIVQVFTPDRLLLHSQDGVLKLVSLTDGALIASFQADKQIVSGDGDAGLRWITAVDQSGQIHFFRLEMGG